MAIESIYWREELVRINKLLQPVRQPKRWSERLVCSVERDTIIGFFIVRRLIELKKVSSKTSSHKMVVYCNSPLTKVNLVNRFSIDKNYDWEKETEKSVSVSYITNQFVHAYMSVLFRDESRNWSEFILFSDYDRNKNLWRVPIGEIIKAFEVAIDDWPVSTRLLYNDGREDYDVDTV